MTSGFKMERKEFPDTTQYETHRSSPATFLVSRGLYCGGCTGVSRSLWRPERSRKCPDARCNPGALPAASVSFSKFQPVHNESRVIQQCPVFTCPIKTKFRLSPSPPTMSNGPRVAALHTRFLDPVQSLWMNRSQSAGLIPLPLCVDEAHSAEIQYGPHQKTCSSTSRFGGRSTHHLVPQKQPC